jgi:hypothetical protein
MSWIRNTHNNICLACNASQCRVEAEEGRGLQDQGGGQLGTAAGGQQAAQHCYIVRYTTTLALPAMPRSAAKRRRRAVASRTRVAASWAPRQAASRRPNRRTSSWEPVLPTLCKDFSARSKQKSVVGKNDSEMF